MIRLLVAAFALLLFAGCEDELAPRRLPCDGQSCPAYQPETVEVPIVNAPYGARQKNWIKYRSGSCYHAAICSNMIWQGLEEQAAWWRQTYGAAESTRGIAQKLDAAGLRFAATSTGDVAFLEWAIRTRRGVAFPYFTRHAINLVHLDAEWAGLQDNNSTGKFIWVRRDEFLHNWRHKYGGCAITVVGSPAPPPLRT